jgi:putative glutamine amidotransferase
MTIAIPGWLTGPNSFGITLGYLNFIQEGLVCGDLLILSNSSPIYKGIDLLILPGGADINPARYGDPPGYYTDKPDIHKEYFDVHILPKYIAREVPIFGICRGLQSIAVHFGGKLIQDIDHHENNPAEDPYKGVHEIVTAGQNRKIKVNSRHHQAVYKHSLEGTPIEVLATHRTQLHHIEAIRIKGQKIAAVQYHPEDLAENSGVQYAYELIKSITGG